MGKIHNAHTITYREITHSEIPTASKLHEQVLESTGSLIGRPYVQALYSDLLSNPQETMVMGAFHGNTLVGLVSVSRSVTATDSVISAHLFELLPRIIISGLKGHISPIEILTRRSLHAYVKSLMKPDDVYIHTLFTDPSHRRRGIASALVGEIQKRMGASYVYVDTRKSNNTAISSYTHMGFELVKEIGNAVLLRSVVRSH